MIKAIIFDFFGVICPDLHEVWTKKHHVPVSIYDEAGKDVDLGKKPENAYINALSSKTGIPAAEIQKEFDAEIIIDQNIIELIKKLKQNYKIGLLSDASSVVLERILKDYSLGQYFDVIGASSKIGYTKQSPKSFQYMLRELQVNPEDTIFIDDYEANVNQAKSLGMKAILYTGVKDLEEKIAITLSSTLS